MEHDKVLDRLSVDHLKEAEWMIGDEDGRLSG